MQDRFGPLELPARVAVWLPISIGLVTALVYGWVWNGLEAGPAIIDEAAYLLQARIFAGGHWNAAARPLPQFFEQLYVFVTPFLAAKYPPGHPLLLALGELVGSPALIVLLLNAISGALVFRLVSMRWGLLSAFLTWLIWLLAPINLSFRPSYLSNVTTSTLWLIAWWALEQWWGSGKRAWFLLLAISVAWCSVTRPLTGLALLVPVGYLSVRRTIQLSIWKDLGLAVGLGAAVLAVLPLANWETTGGWFQMPWTAYAKLYTPYDHLGFGFDSTPPLTPYSPELKQLVPIRRRISERHTIANLPGTAYDRVREILLGALGRKPAPLIALALIGLLFMRKRESLVLLTSLLLILVHLAYAQHARWIPYYLETIPIFAFLTALGLTQLGCPARNQLWRRFIAAGTWTFFALWLVGAIGGVPRARLLGRIVRRPYDAFQATLQRIPDGKAIVFVRKAPWHTLGQSLVFNEPDLERTRVWIVHDLGPENVHLLALARERVPYLYDERRVKLVPLGIADSLLSPQPKR